MSRTLDTLDTIAVKTNLCRKYLVGALCNFKTDLSPSFCSQIMYVQFCETDLFQQISSGEYFNISRDKTLDAKRKTNDWSKPLLNMNNHSVVGWLWLWTHVLLTESYTQCITNNSRGLWSLPQLPPLKTYTDRIVVVMLKHKMKISIPWNKTSKQTRNQENQLSPQVLWH